MSLSCPSAYFQPGGGEREQVECLGSFGFLAEPMKRYLSSFVRPARAQKIREILPDTEQKLPRSDSHVSYP